MAVGRDAEFDAYVTGRVRAWERYSFVLTGDHERARDLLQGVLLTLYRRWDRIADLEHPDAYVRRMLTHAYLSWKRVRGNAEISMSVIPDRAGGDADPAQRVVERDELQRGLRALSPQQRAVLVLRHFEGLDDNAIATVLGCSAGTVRTHASRGRERFRAALAEPAVGGDPR